MPPPRHIQARTCRGAIWRSKLSKRWQTRCFSHWWQMWHIACADAGRETASMKLARVGQLCHGLQRFVLALRRCARNQATQRSAEFHHSMHLVTTTMWRWRANTDLRRYRQRLMLLAEQAWRVITLLRVFSWWVRYKNHERSTSDLLYTTPTSAATTTMVGLDLPHLQIDRSIQSAVAEPESGSASKVVDPRARCNRFICGQLIISEELGHLLGAKNLIVNSGARESSRCMAHVRLQNVNNKESCQSRAGTAASV